MSEAAQENAPDEAAGWPAVERLTLELATRALAAGDSLGLPGSGEAAKRVLALSTSRGQAAQRLAAGGAAVTLLELEDFRVRLIQDYLDPSSSVRLVCGTDPPADLVADLAVLALRRDGGAELARDLLQSFIAALDENGALLAVTDHPDDSWLGDHLRAIADAKAVRRTVLSDADSPHGATAYLVRRSEIRLRVRDFSCEFAFRDQGRLIRAFSRPGVFSHRRLDLGARRLIDAAQIPAGSRVLDIGCGSGVVALAAALRHPDVRVTAIDSSARAVACTRTGAELNGVADRITAVLSSDGSVPEAGTYDIALANPPYFANFRIAELFLETAQSALRPGGQLWIVGKQPDWYQSNVPRWFDRVKLSQTGGGYCIATGSRPAS